MTSQIESLRLNLPSPLMGNPNMRSPKSSTPRLTNAASVNSNALSSGLDTRAPKMRLHGFQHPNSTMLLKSSLTSTEPTLTNQDLHHSLNNLESSKYIYIYSFFISNTTSLHAHFHPTLAAAPKACSKPAPLAS